MLVLAFDTSTPAVTVAVGRVEPPVFPAGEPSGQAMVVDGPPPQILSQRVEVATNRHGELLAPLIDAVLREADVAPGDLDAIGVGLGPGPFTGLRVGIVTAKSMGDALRIPTYGVCSLDVVAHQHADSRGEVAVLTDARRQQVYWAIYNDHGRRLDGPDLDTAAAVADRLRGRLDTVVGAGALLYRDALAGFEVVDDAPYPEAAELIWVLEPRVLRGEPSDALVPMYLRRPDAKPPGALKKVTPV